MMVYRWNNYHKSLPGVVIISIVRSVSTGLVLHYARHTLQCQQTETACCTPTQSSTSGNNIGQIFQRYTIKFRQYNSLLVQGETVVRSSFFVFHSSEKD